MRRMGVAMKWLAMAAVAGSLVACATPSSDGAPSSQGRGAEAGAVRSPYDDTSWELVRWASVHGKVRVIPVRSDDGQVLTLDFDHRGPGRAARVSGFAGCNRYFGSYRPEASGLVIDNIGMTRMACVGEQQQLETDFIQGLLSVSSAAPEPLAQPRHLVLVLADGDVLSFARRMGASPEAGSLRQIYLDDRKVPCTGVAPQTCYRVRDSKDSPWQLFYGNIEDFEFQPGTSYLLRVREIQVDNPPADASSVRWVLDAVLEQRSVVE